MCQCQCICGLTQGQNGAGKSTTMRLLAGKDDQFDGHITRAPGITVAHLDQVTPSLHPYTGLLVVCCRSRDKHEAAMKMPSHSTEFHSLSPA